ncbi:MAG TPA: hypothetical protein VF011_01335 [Terriglobales bacterium]
MPKGRSTFTKRQKEQARQQKQRDKAMRRSERKQAKPQSPADEMRELHEHAAAQAALFDVPGHQESVGRDDDHFEEMEH